MTHPSSFSVRILLLNAGIGFAVFLLSAPSAGINAFGLGLATMIASLCCGPAWWGRWDRSIREAVPEELPVE